MNWLFRKVGFDDGRRLVQTPVDTLGIDVYSREWSARTGPSDLLPIVLIAGLGVSSRYWVPLARRLADRHDVRAIDLPGFGHTANVPGAPVGPSPREQANQLLAWMNARDIGRAILCGHSVGCQTVADFAARFPERVERLILAAPTYEAGKRSFAHQIPRLLAGAFVEIPWLHLVLNLEYGSAGPRRVIAQAARSLEDKIELKLPHITVPTLLMRGQRDPVVTEAWARTLAALLPHGGYAEIGDVGHAIQFSAPDVTAATIERFLRGELDAASPHEGDELVPRVAHRQLGPLSAPPQPISPLVHEIIGSAFAGATLALITSPRYGPKTRRTLATAALMNAATVAFTDFELGVAKKLPMATHASLDFMVGANLLLTAATRLRHEPEGRRATAFLGACQMAVALLTFAPTGPARWRSTKRQRELADHDGSKMRSTRLAKGSTHE